jgi:hypothetical protein
LNAYPNPVRTSVKIFANAGQDSRPFVFTLVDVRGKRISETVSGIGECEFKTGELKNGLYLLRVKTGVETGYKKILVQK